MSDNNRRDVEGMGPPPAGCARHSHIGTQPLNAKDDFPAPESPEAVQVCCVLTGDWPGASQDIRQKCPDLGAHYVRVLYETLSKFAPVNTEWRFTCFTDRPTIEGIPETSCRSIPDRLYSYFSKLYCFSKDAFPLNSRVLFLDLDTAVVKNWTPLARLPLDKIVMLKDVWAQSMPASGIMSWGATLATQRIWTDFAPQSKLRPPYSHPTPRRFPPGVPSPILSSIRTDEHWMHHYTVHNDWRAIQDLLPGEIVSYKYDVVRTMRRDGSKHELLSEEAARKIRVVYFHGRPRPHEVVAKWNPFWRGILDV